MKGAAGAGEPPDLLGDAVHVHGEADSPVTDEGEPKFFLTHGRTVAGERRVVEAAWNSINSSRNRVTSP